LERVEVVDVALGFFQKFHFVRPLRDLDSLNLFNNQQDVIKMDIYAIRISGIPIRHTKIYKDTNHGS
jgi:hypothetical protein